MRTAVTAKAATSSIVQYTLLIFFWNKGLPSNTKQLKAMGANLFNPRYAGVMAYLHCQVFATTPYWIIVVVSLQHSSSIEKALSIESSI